MQKCSIMMFYRVLCTPLFAETENNLKFLSVDICEKKQFWICSVLYIMFRWSWTSVSRRILRSETIFGSWKPIKNDKNDAFYFMSKVPFFLKIFKFLFWLFGHVAKRLEKEDKVNFKLYIVTARLTKKFTTHITQYLEKQRQSDNEIWSVNRM